MQFVGEAVRDHMITLGSNDKSVVALGIASWGCVANRAALDGEGVKYELNPISLRKAKIVYNFGLYKCNRVKVTQIGHRVKLFGQNARSCSSSKLA